MSEARRIRRKLRRAEKLDAMRQGRRERSAVFRDRSKYSRKRKHRKSVQDGLP